MSIVCKQYFFINMLNALLGPSLDSSKLAQIDTDKILWGMEGGALVAQISKYFFCHVGIRACSQRVLDACDIVGEVLGGVGFINETKGLMASFRWKKEIDANQDANDFHAKRAQVYSKIFFNCTGIFFSTVTVGFLLKRIHVISFSSLMEKRLEKIDRNFYLCTEVFSLCKKVYQLYLCNSLSHNSSSEIKKELDRKYKLSLLGIAKEVVEVFLTVFKKVFERLEGTKLALNSYIFMLKISSHLYDNHFSYKGEWQFSSKRGGFAYASKT